MLYNKLIPVKKYLNLIKRISFTFFSYGLIGIKAKGIEKAQRNIVSKIDLKAII